MGVISNAYYNENDGWYWCEGVIWDETALNLVNNKGWSVSCSYDFLEQDDEGGSENNIPYDREFTKLNFVHLALVDNPRYERASIVFNSKTFKEEEHPRDEKGRWAKDDTAIQKKKDVLKPIEIDKKDIPQFSSKKELGKWFANVFKDLGSVSIVDTGIKIDLYPGNANREAFKRRFQQEANKAVGIKFAEMLEKSIKVDERKADERHIHDQDQYFNKLKIGDDLYNVDIFADYLKLNDEYRYAGHKTTKIDNKISTRDTQVINHIMLTKVDNNIITENITNLNPNITKHEDKELDMSLIEELKNLINKVENNKGGEMDKEKEVDNEKVDKRKLIDEVAGIMKSAGATDDKATKGKHNVSEGTMHNFPNLINDPHIFLNLQTYLVLMYEF